MGAAVTDRTGAGPPSSIARGAVAVALALPWLGLLPLGGGLGLIAHGLTLVAACHGAGLVIGRLAARPGAHPLVVVQWGLAALIGLSGVAIATRIGTLASHAALIYAAAAVHTSWLGLGFASHAGRVSAALAGGPRGWLVPAAALAGFGALAVLGAGSDGLVQPFDDEGHVVAQLARVLETGALADPIGYPRSAQLGGQIAVAALAEGAGAGVVRIVEPLAMILALALAVSQIGARPAGAALWALVLVVAGFALAFAPIEPLPCWIAVGLSVALYTMLGDDAPPPALALAITAGALITLRYELAPIAAVALVIAWQRRRHDHHRTAILIGGVFAIGFPFLVARMVAWRSVPLIAQAQLAGPAQLAFAARLALAAAIAAPAALVLRLIAPDSRAVRAAATATGVALGVIAAHVTAAGPYSLRLAWPVAIGFAIIVVIELARRPVGAQAALDDAERNAAATPTAPPGRWAAAAGSLVAVVLCVLIVEGREAPGRLRWSRRLAAAAEAAEYLAPPPATAAPPYARLLAGVPPDAVVAVWVSAPEHLDYARHRIVDIRTPIGNRLRQLRRTARGPALEPLLAGLSASFLLVESDRARIERGQAHWLARLVCRAEQPWCADPLEAIALGHLEVARAGNLQLVDLRRHGHHRR